MRQHGGYEEWALEIAGVLEKPYQDIAALVNSYRPQGITECRDIRWAERNGQRWPPEGWEWPPRVLKRLKEHTR